MPRYNKVRLILVTEILGDSKSRREVALGDKKMNSRLKFKLTLVIFAAVAIVFVMAAPSFAYPAGWTSDVTLVAGGVTQADTAVENSNPEKVYVIYLQNSGSSIKVIKSTDQGNSWSAPVSLETSGDFSQPQISVNQSNGDIYASYISGGNIKVKISSDYGITFADFTAYDGATDITWLSMSHNSEIPVLAWTRTSSGYTKAYYSNCANPMSPAAFPDPDTDPDPQIDWSHVDLDADGSTTVMACRGVDREATNDSTGLWTLVNGTLTRRESSIYCNYPDVAFIGSGMFGLVYTYTNGSNKSVYRRTYDSGWGGFANLYDSGTTEPYPKMIPDLISANAVCRANGNTDVEYATSGADIPVMKSAGPSTDARGIAAAHNNSNDTYLAAVTMSNILLFKRTDTTAPTGNGITVTGSNYVGGVHYVNSDFRVTWTPADINWTCSDATGATNDGAPFWNGVTEIDVGWNMAVGSWTHITNLTSSPFTATIPINVTTEQGSLYINGTMTDTAENQSDEYDSDTRVMVQRDTVSPAAPDVTPDPDLNWTNGTVTVNIDGNNTDDNFWRNQYKIDNGNWADGSAGDETTSFAVSDDGDHTVYCRVMDKAANTSAAVVETIKIDKTPPSIEITRPDSSYMYADTRTMTYRLGAGCSDSGSGMAKSGFKIDGKQVYETDSGFKMAYVWDVSGASEGWHDIEVFAEDSAGNAKTETRRAYLVKSSAPPEAPDPYDPDYRPSMMDWYFAEGNTYSWFDEYITIMNPSDEDTANVTFEFMYGDGVVTPYSATVAPMSRATVTVKSVPGVRLDSDVSVRLRSDKPIVAERPCYFSYDGWNGGHNVVGIDTLYDEYYFAEGATRNGFDTWLTILNPNDTATAVTINYILGDGRVIPKSVQVGAKSRTTINPVTDVGVGQDVSIHVKSDEVIAVERPVYFNYGGITDGTDVAGSPVKMKEWNFAEGNTYAWNTEYICVQNVEDENAGVKFEFMLGDGTVIPAGVTVKAHSRGTYNIKNWVAEGNDVSTRVFSDQPIVAERPMYFTYQGKWTGGTVNMGTTSLRTSSTYYLAEGYTGSGFDEWITIMNPGNGSYRVDVLYLSNGGQAGGNMFVLGEHERLTVNMNTELPDSEVSVILGADGDVVVERPIYFDYRGYTGGHTASGYPWLDD